MKKLLPEPAKPMRPIARVHSNKLVRLAAVAAAALLVPTLAEAKVHITVDLDAQTIHVEAPDQVYDWKVSSGKKGYDTPAGKFNVLWMDKDHHSDEYEQAYMPDSIFFAPGFAIHGFAKSAWGHKASHGCVRLPVAKADILFDLVKAQGADITITGASTGVAPTVASVRAKAAREQAAAADAAPQDEQRAEAPPARAYPRGYGAADGYAQARQYGDPRDSYGYADDDRQPTPVTRTRSFFGSFY